MTAAMVWIMNDMSKESKFNWSVGLTVASVILIFLIRNQTLINGEQFARGMIEHHQMAIVMSEQILKKPKEDPFIHRLAENIITTQKQEIEEMKQWQAQ